MLGSFKEKNSSIVTVRKNATEMKQIKKLIFFLVVCKAGTELTHICLLKGFTGFFHILYFSTPQWIEQTLFSFMSEETS